MKCPFCYYSYYDYKTPKGLWRHVEIYHITRRYTDRDEEEYLVIASQGQVQYVPLTREDKQDLRDFLHDYFNGRFEPSKRSSRWWSYVRRSGTGT